MPETKNIPETKNSSDDRKMDGSYLGHLIVVAFLISAPLWPKKQLKYTVWTPLLLSFIWVVFDGCPISKIHMDTDGEHDFLYSWVHPLLPSLTRHQINELGYFFLLLQAYVGTYRLWKT